MKYTLHPEQQEAVNFALSNDRVGLTLPTAFGKSFIAHALASKFTGRTVIITVSNELVKQFITTFKTPYLIGKKHYRKKDYERVLEEVRTSSIVVTNPAAFHKHKEAVFQEFDNIIIDEADACLGLFKLQIGSSYGTYFEEMSVKQIYDLLCEIDEYRADAFVKSQQYKFWRIEETIDSDKKKNKEPYTLRIHDVTFHGKAYFKDYKRVVLMSGTLFNSDIKELLGDDIPTYEAPSPIPVERRKIVGFLGDGFEYSPDDPEELSKIIKNALLVHKERPVIIHTTYGMAPKLASFVEDAKFFTEKDEKLNALLALEGSNDALLASGCQVGLDLNEDKCRLNILLHGFFPNLIDMQVAKRKALPFGEEWYVEQTLKTVIQACGRSTRSVDDYSKILICDPRIVRLIKNNKEKIPKYFLEACNFL